MNMNTALFRLTLALLTLAPLGAAAQIVDVDAGEDVVKECLSPDGTAYQLQGIAPTGEGIVNEWTTDPEVELRNPDTLTPTGRFPLGVTIVTLTSTADGGEPESDSATVTMEDTKPPEVVVTLDPWYLWPPNHSMHEVEAQVDVTDACGGDDDLDVVLVDVTSDEPDNSTGDGNTTNDIDDDDIGEDDRSVMLRAERKGNGDGRVYTLTYGGTDANDNKTETEANVYVPHDYADLKDLIGDDDRGDLDPICPRPLEAVAELTAIHPGLGSVRNVKACNKVCKAWSKSCGLIAKGTAKCVRGEERALALIDVAECKDSDDGREIRACIAGVKDEASQQKGELKVEANAARAICAQQAGRCEKACDNMFGEILPVED
jgi:hypothetical protein